MILFKYCNLITSGSIGDEDLNAFLSEIKGICDTVKPSKVRLLYWDTVVRKQEVYLQDELDGLVHATKPAGGGGTDPDCVPNFLLKKGIKPQCIVMLTDGVFFGHETTKWEELGVPVLWCVVGNNEFKPKVGQAVCVE